MARGLFITFEGIEGCGKSTQVDRLRTRLEARGLQVDLTREPGGTPIAEAIRDLLLDPANQALSPTAELLLYEAARAQHVAERIRPALESGTVVLCDRFYDSTTAYQGAGRALDPEIVRELHTVATGGLDPDLTLLLDLPAKEGLARAKNTGEPDRIEREALEFHERVREGFLTLVALFPDRIKHIDATQSIDDVSKEIATHLDALLEREGFRAP